MKVVSGIKCIFRQQHTRDIGVLSIGAVFEECRPELNLIVPWLSSEMLQVLCGKGTTCCCAHLISIIIIRYFTSK